MIAAAWALASATLLIASIITARIATRLPTMPADYHKLVRGVACLLPRTCALDWAEETQAQLSELAGRQRHKLLGDVLAKVPILCATTWLVHRQHSRALRQQSTTFDLVARLHGHLQPSPIRSHYLPADAPDTITLLQTLGLTRNLRRWRTRTIPPLQLARQLLSTRTPNLEPARTAARQLLQTRERAHLIARGLLRDQHKPGIRANYSPHQHRHEQLGRLRANAASHAAALRTELNHYIHQHRTDNTA